MPFVMPDVSRRRAIGQILLVAAGFLVLVAISVASVLLVNKARDFRNIICDLFDHLIGGDHKAVRHR